MMRVHHLALGAVLILAVSGCEQHAVQQKEASPAPEVTNRIPIPPEVVSNIGITFERAERGKVGRWLRVPGRLVVPEDRRWTLRAAAEGRISPRVRAGQWVEKSSVLLVLESPALKAAQRSLMTAASHEKSAEIEAASASSRFDEAQSLWEQAVGFETRCDARKQRVHELLQAASASSQKALSTKELLEAEREWLDARERTLEAAVLRDDLRTRRRNKQLEVSRARVELGEVVSTLAVLTGRTAESLTESDSGEPAWHKLSTLELLAPESGIVMSVSVANGEHVAAGTPLVTLFEPSTLLFRGTLPESDLSSLRPSAPVRIEAAGNDAGPIVSELWPAPPEYDEQSRTLRVSAWVPNRAARFPHGLSATAHVLVAESANEEVLLDEACVIFDGLEAVVFRRDPAEPDVVIRTLVEIGARGAGRAEILSGVLDGDEVVLAGVYQLKEVGRGKAPQSGHFHADGSFHDGED